VLTTIKRIATRINGREYHIEIACMDDSTWRAQVVTRYGGRTALMPFYGSSSDDAEQRLSEWLQRASRPAPTSV
jgi:hypothetical protein